MVTFDFTAEKLTRRLSKQLSAAEIMTWDITVKTTSTNKELKTAEWAVIDVLDNSFAIFFHDKRIPSDQSTFKNPKDFTIEFNFKTDITLWTSDTKIGIEKAKVILSLSDASSTSDYDDCKNLELEQAVDGILKKSSYKLFTGGEYTYDLESTYLKKSCAKVYMFETKEVGEDLQILPAEDGVLVRLLSGFQDCEWQNFTLIAKPYGEFLD